MDIRTPGTGSAGRHVSFRTTCGREIRVSRLILGGGRHPAQVPSPASDEARRLAAALLLQAAACDLLPPQA